MNGHTKASLVLVRLAIALSAVSLLGDLFGWNTCGGNVCVSGLWARYRHFFGVLPVSGVALLALFVVQSLWQLHLSDPIKHAAYLAQGCALLALSAGGALFHVYLQAVVIGDFCLLCLGIAGSVGLALALVLLRGPRKQPARCALGLTLGFLAVNFMQHHGPELPAVGFEGAYAQALVQRARGDGPAGAELEQRLRRTMTLGHDAAPVTLEVFSDLACPHCARFEAEVLPGLIHDFAQTGKLRITLRSFYAQGHEQARIADVLARATALLTSQETYLTARRRLFEATQAPAGDLKAAIADLADTQALARMLEQYGDLVQASIQSDLQRAQDLGISAPPSFAIHAPHQQNIFMGMQRPAVFRAAIEHALRQP